MSSNEHYLHFLEHEDEAQMTGYKFSVNGDEVIVSETYHYQEYEANGHCQVLSKVEARKLWKKLIDSGSFKEIKTRR